MSDLTFHIEGRRRQLATAQANLTSHLVSMASGLQRLHASGVGVMVPSLGDTKQVARSAIADGQRTVRLLAEVEKAEAALGALLNLQPVD